MKYFVTGATGFIGGAVVRLLVRRGDEVVALVRDPARARHLADQGVQLVGSDLSDPEQLRVSMRGADGVFHIAGWYKVGVADHAAAWATNVEGTRNVLAAMAEEGITKGVYTSTLAVNSDTHGVEVDESYHFVGEHLSLYDATKAEAHRIAGVAIAQGLPLVIVMPGLVYGPDDPSSVGGALRQLLRGRLPALPHGTQYNWAHVDDTARAHLLAMDHGHCGQRYIIAGQRAQLLPMMRLAAQEARVRAPLGVPPAAMRATGVVTGPLARVLPIPAQYTPEALRVVAGVSYLGSNAKARRDLGFEPRPLADGWVDTVHHEMATLDA